MARRGPAEDSNTRSVNLFGMGKRKAGRPSFFFADGGGRGKIFGPSLGTLEVIYGMRFQEEPIRLHLHI